jgi:hypothetical protein
MRAVRATCMAAAVLIVAEVALGTAVNLYVTLPKNVSVMSAASHDAVLAVHAVIAIVLFFVAATALVRAVRLRHRLLIWTCAIGVVAVVAASEAGAEFVKSTGNGESMGMAAFGVTALLSYLVGIFSTG